MRPTLIGIAIASALAIFYILLAWGFSPDRVQLKREHLLRIGRMEGSDRRIDRLNLRIEKFGYLLIQHRSALLLTFFSAFAASVILLAS